MEQTKPKLILKIKHELIQVTTNQKIAIKFKEHHTVTKVTKKYNGSKRCQSDGCQTRPSFGLPGHQSIHCAVHKQIGEKVNPMKKCQSSNCRNLALFGYTVAIHCEQHKFEQEVDLIQRKCVSCGLLDVLDEKALCPTCDPKH